MENMENKNQKSTYMYITSIPEEVREAIEAEVKKISSSYKVREIIRYKHPDDKNLYRVVAEMIGNDTYAYWDCFNASTNSLNYGHYHISFEEAMQLMWCRPL